MNKIIDNQDRNVLCEGRSYQMGFAFVKQVSKNVFETVHPISPCKDYLNDIVWTEATGKEIQVHGLKYQKQSLWKAEDEVAYLVIKICDRFGGGGYANLEADKERLLKNYKKLQALMRHFEKLLKIKNKTVITKTTTKGLFLVRLDSTWRESTYMISLYSLLLRVGQFWDGETEIMHYLDTFGAFSPDVYLLGACLLKLKRIIDGHKILSNLHEIYAPHDEGILSYQLNEEEE